MLETSGLPHTAFETDAADHDNGVWPKVFGNLTDFGLGFAWGEWREGTAPTPNPYGPILLIARPSILLKSADVAICLRSAGGRKFDREAESLGSVPEVDRLFVHKLDEVWTQGASFVKYSDALRQEFGDKYRDLDYSPSTYNPEISCTIVREYLPFDDLECIITDKYRMNGHWLSRVVRDIAFDAGLRRELKERSYRSGRDDILASLARAFAGGPRSLSEIVAMENVSSPTKDWGRRLISSNLEWQFRRFVTYLEEGTLSEMRKLP